ncbi:Ig-like domain-containing protein [Clostridium estertheticum]|uniref:Ig-like domain-containing protein n=1 Tax=Clostridium estertheticum TaxID=238834 RepID=UPI001C7D5057|nr:Ig-like domain-containing protein [Clostridium estertheticum]MBX4267465.1 Ig-like domain-containing protein [Clostridium estertheticum]WLC87830.1 Ig-like domain-containing protein [Clostridium estertheticum]
MNKKITSSVLVALMIAGSTSFSAFAAMPTGTVVIGTKAFDLTYANNSANASEITAAMVDGGSVYFKDFNGDWIDNIKGSKVAASLMPAVIYKSTKGTTNFAASDIDTNTVATSVALSAMYANQLKETFNGKVADTSKVVFTVKRGTTPVTMFTTWNDAKTEATLTYGDNLPEGTYTVGVMNNTTDIGSSTVAVAKQKVSKIEIGDTLAVDLPTMHSDVDGGEWPGDGHVSYKVLDQYGGDITENSLASNINWKSPIGKISASKGIITISILEGSANYNVGLLTQYKTIIITATDSDSNAHQSTTLKVVGQSFPVTSVNKVENTTKNIGDSYTLPTTVTATLVDKTTKDFAVTWDKVASTKVAGQFTFTGTLTMVDGIVNTDNVTASATLIVATPIIDKTDITSKFTDDNFKSIVYSKIGKTAPSPILESDVKDIKSLDLSGAEVSSSSGLEYFTSLTELNCSNNELVTLDVSKNTALIALSCWGNKLTTLDVSKNVSLDILQCSMNQLTKLNVDPALTSLNCTDNKLTTIDLSKNLKSMSFKCDENVKVLH